jgi:endonuclease/exonuclease/phosphatase family metal-dependent hydrolase
MPPLLADVVFTGRTATAARRDDGDVELAVDVTSTQHSPLKVARLQRGRGYAVSHVPASGHPAVTFVSMHLSLDAAERREHAASILKALSRVKPWSWQAT